MIRKIKAWFERRKANKVYRERFDAGMSLPDLYSRKQLENAYRVGYNDGRAEGLSVARQQAVKSLKEILSWQNQSKK